MNAATPSRRAFLGGAFGAAGLLALTACGSSTETVRQSVTSTRPFRYTDARGKKIDLPVGPQVVVAQSSAAAALWDAGYRVAGVYGELGIVGGRLDYQAGNLDLNRLTVLGKTYGKFDIERYAALRPDLLIDESMDDKTLWYVPAGAAEKIYQLAPAIGMKTLGLDVAQLIAEFVDLADRLGAPADSASAQRDRTAFDSAVDRVKTVAATRQNVRVLAVSRTAEAYWVADPRVHPDLKHLAAQGVRFVVPDEPDNNTFFWQYSWEQAGKYPADVIVYDAREAAEVTSAVAKIDTWTNLPAVQAKQVYEWKPAAPYSYRTYAPLYRAVADWLGSAKRIAAAGG